MAKEIKEINLDDEEMPIVDPEETEIVEEPMPIEEPAIEVVENQIADAEEVNQVISSYFSKKTKKTMKGFFEVFLKSTDEHPDLSMQDYKSFLENIHQNVSEEEYPKYQEIFAKVLLARKKRIEAHDQKQNFEKFKLKTLREMDETYQNINRNQYAPSKLAAIERSYTSCKQQVENAETKEKVKLVQQKFEASIRSTRTKKKARRRLGIILGSVFAAVAVIAAILCVGAIPRVDYTTVQTINDYELDKNGNVQLVPRRNVVVAGVRGLYMPFHFPMNTIDLRDGNSNTQRVIGIEEGAFEGSSIETVYLPISLTTFSENAFANCKNLKRITYSSENENNLHYATLIGENAFRGCTSLDSITISSNIIYIERNSFANCGNDFKLIYTGNSTSWKAKGITPLVKVECKSYIVSYLSNNPITVWFNSNGGSYVESQTVSKTTPLRYPSVPTKSGYIFAGWYRDAYCNTPFEFNESINEDMTLYADWISLSSISSSNIIPVNNNGTVVNYDSSMQYYAFVPLVSQTITIYTTGNCDTVGYLYDSTLSQISYNDDGGSNYNFSISYSVTANTLYYIGVTFYGSGTSGSASLYLTGTRTPVSSVTVTESIYSKEVQFGKSYTIPYEYRSGYSFVGYYLEPSFRTKVTDSSGACLAPWTFTDDMTVYGKYE